MGLGHFNWICADGVAEATDDADDDRRAACIPTLIRLAGGDIRPSKTLSVSNKRATPRLHVAENRTPADIRREKVAPSIAPSISIVNVRVVNVLISLVRTIWKV